MVHVVQMGGFGLVKEWIALLIMGLVLIALALEVRRGSAKSRAAAWALLAARYYEACRTGRLMLQNTLRLNSRPGASSCFASKAVLSWICAAAVHVLTWFAWCPLTTECRSCTACGLRLWAHSVSKSP